MRAVVLWWCDSNVFNLDGNVIFKTRRLFLLTYTGLFKMIVGVLTNFIAKYRHKQQLNISCTFTNG